MDTPTINTALMVAPNRSTCMKCGTKISGDATGENCWCSTCRYLLRRPDPPHARYSTITPSRETLDRLGLIPTVDEKQALEPVPNGRHVEHWYDPDEPEFDPAARFESIFKRAINSAA